MRDGKLSKSRALAAKVIYAALIILKEKGGELSGREVIDEVEKRVQLDEWARERYEKTGYIRWQSILHFFTIDCIKAGYLVKKKGVWFLTPEGEAALKLGEVELLKTATDKYREWKIKNQPDVESSDSEEPEGADVVHEREMTVDEIEQLAMDGIRKFIYAKNAYEFQDI